MNTFCFPTQTYAHRAGFVCRRAVARPLIKTRPNGHSSPLQDVTSSYGLIRLGRAEAAGKFSFPRHAAGAAVRRAPPPDAPPGATRCTLTPPIHIPAWLSYQKIRREAVERSPKAGIFMCVIFRTRSSPRPPSGRRRNRFRGFSAYSFYDITLHLAVTMLPDEAHFGHSLNSH
ncbi:hypothetical protein EVAR_58023_1 [Eumeta japonica]|uniref:Uncharacterized protein n=1 Tax=Eumeta variegata TaxID=151549 RepID=A0A4C2A9Z1_EUMVA|nr:hypothetical protein EVAR_58023_1 [Eumeta japonica]